ncbi:2267_t:CDS:2, partial [Dentiscutata heterogama]
MGNELSRKISYKKSTIKKFKPRRITIPTIRHRNLSSNSTMYSHHDLHQSPQSSQIKCRHFFRFFDDQGCVVYEATWLNGRRCKRGKNEKGRRCSRTEPIKVVLKSIKNSKNMSNYYIKSLKEYYRYSALICPQRIQNYLEFYGVTQNPTSGEYMLVIQHATFGSLRQFMHASPSTFASFKWSEKLWWLCDIASNLLVIHKSRYVHGNLHTGNILQVGMDERETYSTIADLGLCIPANSISSIATCEKSLNGLRPQIPNTLAPKRFRNLVERCCHPDPLERPTAKQLKYIFDYWYQCAIGNLRRDSRCMKIMNEFLRADEQANILFQESEMFEQEEEMKDKTWFTSRLWTFKLNNDSITELITSTEIMENWEMQQSQKSEQKSQRITTEPENNTSS